MRKLLRAAWPGIALSILALAQPWLEQRMVRHMAGELPLVFAIGWFTAANPSGRFPKWFETVDVSGLTGLTFAMLVSAFWMLPIALDAAVLNPAIGWMKVASVLSAGVLARQSMARSGLAMQAFFVLNWVWMTAAVGIVYQQAPERLCSTYLLGDQSRAGVGLVGWAILVAAVWLVSALRNGSDDEHEFPATGTAVLLLKTSTPIVSASDHE